MIKNIIIDCERMRHSYNGLYHYCYHLGNSILKVINEDHENVSFYLPDQAENVFGKDINRLPQNFTHKFLFPNIKKIDVWHCTYQGSKYYPFGKNLAKILTVHDLNFLYDRNRSKAKIRRHLSDLQRKIDDAQHIVAISSFVLDDLNKHLSLSNKSTSVIYNGCNVDDLSPITQPEVTYNEPFLFTIGTIVSKKNFHVLPPLLHNNNYKLVIAGIESSRDYKKQILKVAEAWNVADRIVFTGPISENDKKWYLSNCAAFLFPSIAEGFGLPVIEAMYFGKPVILSKCTSLPEIGGDSAYYFENFDPAHMQEVLIKSLDHYTQTNPGDKIRDRAKSFSWERTAMQYLELYRTISV
jgi:glycosyltransferase involved in cell wall biosynthesis